MKSLYSISFLALFAASSVGAPADAPTYWKDIRPILRRNCTACHSAKHVKDVDVSGGLALDTYESVRKGGKERVVEAGKSAASKMMKLIQAADENQRMPLGSAALSAENIALIRRWIDGGAQEGTKPAETAESIVATKRKTRKLDVVLTTNTTAPAGALVVAKAGKLDLDLKIGPLSPIAAVVYSPDGKLLAMGGYGHVTIWDLATVHPITELTNVLGAVNDIRFSPDASLLAVAGGQPSAKGDLRLYRTKDWKLETVLRGHADVVYSVAFRPDGKQLASASFDKTIGLWDLTTYKLERSLTGHSDTVYAVAYSPDGKSLVSCSKDHSVRVTDPTTGKSRLTFSGMDQDVLAVAVHPDGKSVVSSGMEPAIYWWDAKTGQRTKLQRGHGVAVHELSFNKDGKWLASAGADKTVRLWNGTNGAALRTIAVGSIVYAVALAPSGQQVAAGSFDGMVRLYDTTTGRHLATLLAMPDAQGKADWLALTPEGYATGSPAMTARGQWRITGQKVDSALAWRSLNQPAMLAQAVRGEVVKAPEFAKAK